ncbi:MAG TPA: hypothetical protein VNK52_13135, partial [Hyphomicrobiaceae bacterium]|nr:hypothetical protein [Hyphomicrobiaceae bacterium]
ARALCQLATSPRLAGKTRCLLLDEPTASLDPAHQVRVLGAIRRQSALGLAVLVVLHDLNLASAVADRILLLKRGRMAASGPPAEVLREDVLSAAYDCRISVVASADAARPLVLPPFVSSPPASWVN